MCSDGALPKRGVRWMAAGGGGSGLTLGSEESGGGAGRSGVVDGMDACIFSCRVSHTPFNASR